MCRLEEPHPNFGPYLQQKDAPPILNFTSVAYYWELVKHEKLIPEKSNLNSADYPQSWKKITLDDVRNNLDATYKYILF